MESLHHCKTVSALALQTFPIVQPNVDVQVKGLNDVSTAAPVPLSIVTENSKKKVYCN